MNRRTLLKSLAVIAASAGLGADSEKNPTAGHPSTRMFTETTIRTPFIPSGDGVPLFFKDWGAGKPLIFMSSWAMNADMWQYQMTPMVSQGFRCIAYDRRGHGRSGQPSHGYDYDTLATIFPQ